MVAEYNASGDLIKEYHYHPGASWMTNPLFQRDAKSNSLYYYQNDHLGTPQRLIKASGEVVWEGQSQAFGKTKTLKETVSNALRFPGQYFDEETGLYYNYFRYYDPVLGRHIQSDPIGLDGGLNTYGYAGANPLVFIDPTGELALAVPIAAVIIIAAGTGYIISQLPKGDSDGGSTNPFAPPGGGGWDWGIPNLRPPFLPPFPFKGCPPAGTMNNEKGGGSDSDQNTGASSGDKDTIYDPEDWDNVEYGKDGPYTPVPDGFFPEPKSESNNNSNSGVPNKNRTNKKYNPVNPHRDLSGGNKGDKHSNGDTRRKKDRGGEKGDVRRPY